MNNIYRVKRRNQKVEIAELGLKCDALEVPYPLTGESNDFFVGVTEVESKRSMVDQAGLPVDGEDEVVGLFASCVFDGTLAMIVALQSEVEPSYWLTIPLAGAKVEAGGQVGLFRKRPAFVKVVTDDLVVKLGEPGRLYPKSRRVQGKRSPELLDLLRATAAAAPRTQPGAGQ